MRIFSVTFFSGVWVPNLKKKKETAVESDAIRVNIVDSREVWIGFFDAHTSLESGLKNRTFIQTQKSVLSVLFLMSALLVVFRRPQSHHVERNRELTS